MAEVVPPGASMEGVIEGDGVNGHGDTPKYATNGIIYPPPDIRAIIDRTAMHVARSQNPAQFEDRVRESQRTDPKFAFLNPSDAYHAYYRHRIERIQSGEAVHATTGAALPSAAAEEGAKEGTPVVVPVLGQRKGVPKEPAEMAFVANKPKIAPVDLDTLKLTALFFAVRGPSFLQSLSVREGKNPTFEFLRPTHPLFGYFSRLVAQYKTVLLPTKEGREKVRARAGEGGKDVLLGEARERAEWERWRREREKKKKEDMEADRIAFAEIDWHDYAIVQTIEFTLADSQSDLPPPMTLSDIESMTLAQKRMAQMINESTTEDIRAANEAADVRAKEAVALQVAGVKRKQAEVDAEEVAAAAEKEKVMEDEDMDASERRRAEEEKREHDRARMVQAQAQVPGGQMKIKENYVPKGIQRATKAMTTCPICHLQVGVDELDEHMRIELLDPRWKSQRDALESRRAQASELQQGANVASSLKQLARTRVDIFGGEQDEEARKREEERERERAKERERIVWDGHTNSAAGTADRFQANVNLEEQIAAIHRAKGFMDAPTTGPGIGPSLGPGIPAQAAPLPAPNDASYIAATISAGPQPASSTLFGGPATFTPAAATPAGFVPPGMHPSRAAALGGDEPAPGQAEDAPPPAKRPRIERPPNYTYTESDWLALHPDPITLQIQLPSDPSRPEWKLDGTVCSVPNLPLDLLVSTLRDRIVGQLESQVPVGRIRLSFGGKTLTNGSTLAGANLEEGDVVMLTVRETRKR